jgi:DNA-binding transcriptional ArsR family regulator
VILFDIFSLREPAATSLENALLSRSLPSGGNPVVSEIHPNIAEMASLIGDPIRAAMLWALMAGEARPAGELAAIAGASPQSASGHLTRLAEGGVVTVEARGRHRYYRLSGSEAAAAIEALAGLATSRAREPTQRTVSLVPRNLRHARRCWGHLAGELGVAVLRQLVDAGWLRPDGKNFVLTAAGVEGMKCLGVAVGSLKRSGRGLAYQCLDWSERVPHLGGPLAHALLQAFFEKDWLRQTPGSRKLELTPFGRREIGRLGETSVSAFG